MSVLPFKSAADLAAEADEEIDYIVEQLLIREAITIFSAKIKAGKTTFNGNMLYCIINSEPFIGLSTKPAKVIYCTEEGRKTFKRFMERTGILDAGDRLEVLFLADVPKHFSWPDIVDDVLSHALTVNADAVVFDTLTRWAKVKPDQENDAGAAALVMEPLEALRKARLAVLGIFHERKSGGDISDAARGSSAYGGAADILMALKNPDTNGHPNRRELSTLGRFDDPGTWIIDLVDGHYELQNDKGDLAVERGLVKTQIVFYVDLHPGCTRSELASACGVRDTEGTFRRALADLLSAGHLLRDGTGKRGSPFRFMPVKTRGWQETNPAGGRSAAI